MSSSYNSGSLADLKALRVSAAIKEQAKKEEAKAKCSVLESKLHNELEPLKRTLLASYQPADKTKRSVQVVKMLRDPYIALNENYASNEAKVFFDLFENFFTQEGFCWDRSAFLFEHDADYEIYLSIFNTYALKIREQKSEFQQILAEGAKPPNISGGIDVSYEIRRTRLYQARINEFYIRIDLFQKMIEYFYSTMPPSVKASHSIKVVDSTVLDSKRVSQGASVATGTAALYSINNPANLSANTATAVAPAEQQLLAPPAPVKK